jgi:hypothetical protein
MGAIMDIREGVPTNKPNQSRAIPDTGHIKPLIKEAGDAEDESLNNGILFANDSVWSGGLWYDDVDWRAWDEMPCLFVLALDEIPFLHCVNRSMDC